MASRFISLAVLLLACVSLRAEGTNDVFLFFRNIDTATNALAQLDEALGYPNPSTKTDRAVAGVIHSNGTNCIVRISIAPVFSPRFGRDIDVAEKIREKLTAEQWGTNVLTKTTTVAGLLAKPVSRIDGELAAKVGWFLDQQQ